MRSTPVPRSAGTLISPEKLPSDVGHAFAAMWQGVLDIHQTHNGVRLPIDVNVAAVPSPSEHLALSTGDAVASRVGDRGARIAAAD